VSAASITPLPPANATASWSGSQSVRRASRVNTSRRAPRPRRCSNHAAGVVATGTPARMKATEIVTVKASFLALT